MTAIGGILHDDTQKWVLLLGQFRQYSRRVNLSYIIYLIFPKPCNLILCNIKSASPAAYAPVYVRVLYLTLYKGLPAVVGSIAMLVLILLDGKCVEGIRLENLIH